MNRAVENIIALEDDLRRSGTVSGSWTHLHDFAMRVARVGWAYGAFSEPAWEYHVNDRRPRDLFPLPPKRVLREEPVPGAGHPDILYRWTDGELQRRGPLSGGWEPRVTVDGNRTDLMRHAIDLSERPYREEPQ